MTVRDKKGGEEVNVRRGVVHRGGKKSVLLLKEIMVRSGNRSRCPDGRGGFPDSPQERLRTAEEYQRKKNKRESSLKKVMQWYNWEMIQY